MPSSSTGSGAAPTSVVPPASRPAPLLVPAGSSATVVSDPSRPESPTSLPGAPDGAIPSDPNEVFSEDWWARARPIVELHGYFRTRGELLHNYSLGRREGPGSALGWSASPYNLWAQPLDNSYVLSDGSQKQLAYCGSTDRPTSCQNTSQATANMRLRLSPELIISDNLRVLAQIDALDNMVLGSTPEAYAMQPSGSNNASGYAPALGGYYPWAQTGFFSQTQGPPTAGINGFRNSIDVKRAWAEYSTPVGQLRFGRMPLHWGLGMLYSAGDGLDSDYQTTVDRIMFVSGVKSLDMYFGGSWNFPNTGVTNANAYDFGGGSPVNLANLVNVGEWTLFAARRRNTELQRLELSRGDVVFNGGAISSLRVQTLDIADGQNPYTNNYGNGAATQGGLLRRNALMVTPDAWLQVLWRKFRFEAEFAAQVGSIDNVPGRSAEVVQPTTAGESTKTYGTGIQQFGLATQMEYRAVEDKLRIHFGFGWASGDPWADALNPGYGTYQRELNGAVSGQSAGPMSTFRFNPDYRVDLIFFRRMLTRVEGAYYFRPSVDYDFIRKQDGQKLGGGAAIIWSRASEFVQTPGHKADLGIEIDLQLYYQAKDGSLNDDTNKQGGFFAMLQYGAFFPLGGLQYLPGEKTAAGSANGAAWDVSTAQTVRLFLGVAY